METQTQIRAPGDSTADVTFRTGGSEVSLPATAEEIRRAIDAQPQGANWYLSVGLPNEDWMSVETLEGGSFALTFDDVTDTAMRLASVNDRDLLMSILSDFLQGDGHWRSLSAW